MTRADLVGWTLAEMAFVLLFAVIATVLPAYKVAETRYRTLEAQRNETTRLDAENRRLLKINDSLQAEITQDRKNLRSKALPPCAELDPSSGWLFTATIEGYDAFSIDGKRVTMSEILAAYSRELDQAKQKGCVQSVRVYFRDGISAGDYNHALRLAEGHFYPSILGASK